MIANMDGLRWLAVLLGAVVVTGCNSLETENNRLKQENLALRQEVEGSRQAMQGAMDQRRALEEERLRLEQQLAARQATPAAAPVGTNTNFEGIEGVESFRDANRVTVRIAGDILFDSGKTELKSTAKKTLADVASVIRREYPGKMIRIAGYTDTDPIRRSQWRDNLELSLQRAATVHRELQQAGMDPKQMYAAGYGEWQPRDSKPRSRRVEIVVELN